MEEPDGYQVVSNIPAPSLPYNQPGTCYTLVEITDSEAGIYQYQCLTLWYLSCCCPVTGTFLNTLKFQVKDCDPTTGEPDSDVGYADEYVVSYDMTP